MGFFKKIFGERRGVLVFQKGVFEAARDGRASWLDAVMEEVEVVDTSEVGPFVRVVCRSRHFAKVGRGEETPRYFPEIRMVSGDDCKGPAVTFRRKGV